MQGIHSIGVSRNLKVTAVGLGALWLLFVFYLAGGFDAPPCWLHRFLSLDANAQGDFLAGVLAGPAFLIAALSLWIQGRELKLNREELSNMREELKLQREALEKSTINSEQALQLQKDQDERESQRQADLAKPRLALGSHLGHMPWKYNHQGANFNFPCAQLYLVNISTAAIKRIDVAQVCDFQKLSSELGKMNRNQVSQLPASGYGFKFNTGETSLILPFLKRRNPELWMFRAKTGSSEEHTFRLRIELYDGSLCFQTLSWKGSIDSAEFGDDHEGGRFWQKHEACE